MEYKECALIAIGRFYAALEDKPVTYDDVENMLVRLCRALRAPLDDLTLYWLLDVIYLSGRIKAFRKMVEEPGWDLSCDSVRTLLTWTKDPPASARNTLEILAHAAKDLMTVDVVVLPGGETLSPSDADAPGADARPPHDYPRMSHNKTEA